MSYSYSWLGLPVSVFRFSYASERGRETAIGSASEMGDESKSESDSEFYLLFDVAAVAV